jgi:hypothetical protein
MSTTAQMWLWAMLLPPIMLLSQSMCVWPAPRILGVVALSLLWVSVFTVWLFLAALPASVYFGVTGLIYRKLDGELLRRTSLAASCLCFIGLWILAVRSSNALRHQAFVKASRVGDRVVLALAQYRIEKGEYPSSLEQLIPGYLQEIPYTGMIAYPEFRYRKDSNDIQTSPGSFELRIDCTSGVINFDRFIYWPAGTYPDRIQGNGVERIGKWAYVHE